jgi:ABC-2 type transport system permease protein
MLEFSHYYGRKRLRGSAALAGGLAILASLFLYMFPSLSQGADLDQYVESVPPALREAFGIQALGSIEGFLAAELYSFGWVLLLGLYLAYAAASLVADDVEDGRMDVLLALPVSRSKVLFEKFSSLAVPVAVVNVVVFVVVVVGVTAIGESIVVADLAMVHLLSLPYLLATASVGLAASVYFDRGDIAQRVATGVVFALFLVESVVSGTDFEWIGWVSPTRYYDPAGILVDSEWHLLYAVVLVAGSVVLLVGSREYFNRKDVS